MYSKKFLINIIFEEIRLLFDQFWGNQNSTCFLTFQKNKNKDLYFDITSYVSTVDIKKDASLSF